MSRKMKMNTAGMKVELFLASWSSPVTQTDPIHYQAGYCSLVHLARVGAGKSPIAAKRSFVPVVA